MDSKKKNKFFKNNFEFLRLICAIQVMLNHSGSEFIYKYFFFIDHFPGLPIFFFISGYLVFASYDKTQNIKSFYLNRVLRLYPALILATILGFFLVLQIYSNYKVFDYSEAIKWFFYQLSLGQNYNPYNIDQKINWVTWTLTIEILFYVIVPIFFLNKKYTKFLVYSFLIISSIYWCLLSEINNSLIYYINLTPLKVGWMFMIGSLFYLNFDIIYKYKNYLFYSIIIIFLIILYNQNNLLFKSYTRGHDLGFIYFLFLMMFVFWFAYSIKIKIFNINFDLSYGIYLYHSLVINFLWIFFGKSSLFLIIILTLILSIFSWFLIERKFLKLKINNLKRVY